MTNDNATWILAVSELCVMKLFVKKSNRNLVGGESFNLGLILCLFLNTIHVYFYKYSTIISQSIG